MDDPKDCADLPGLELSDQDILDAMGRVPGYLDITTSDFRELYHMAHRLALGRLFSGLRADRLMRAGLAPLGPDQRLDEAAGALVRQGVKALPVVDDAGRVLGMLTETDFLRRLKAGSFLELLLRLLSDPGSFGHRCHETPVREAMGSPAVTVPADAGFLAILAAFRAHEGRAMPVVDGDGRLLGLLARKEFVAACHLEDVL